MKYMIAKPKHENRPMYYEGKTANITWIPDPVFGTHNSSIEAKKKYLFLMKELDENHEYTDDFIRKYFKPFQNMQIVKVIKV